MAQQGGSGFTRRNLMQYAGALAGSAAVYSIAGALGAVPSFANAQPLRLDASRRPCKVLILGAGVAGLISAYELEKAGYEVQIVEASHRIGGRSLTLRHGDLIDEIGNKRHCQFDNDPGLYFNAGPARIPSEHSNILGYCKELGVQLQPFINDNKAAWMQFDNFNDGQRMRQHQFIAESRGFISELVSKGVSNGWLDQPLNNLDKDRLQEFLSSYGDLSSDGRYLGSSRAGYESGGLLSPGLIRPQVPFEELLASDFWRLGMNFGESATMASVMQPVGGMDNIVRSLAEKVRGTITLNAPVVSVRTVDDGVTVTWRESGGLRTETADYCLNSIPGQLLSGVDNNFPDEFVAKIKARRRGKLSKVGLQMSSRFWEEEGVYGGISWTGGDITQIMYPSGEFGSPKGVLVGAYIFSPVYNDKFMAMTAEERIQMALIQGEKLHPGYANYFESGASVAWYRMNHMLGCTATEIDESTAASMREPRGNHYLIGDQVAHHSGWQESAVLSAHEALNSIQAREAAR